MSDAAALALTALAPFLFAMLRVTPLLVLPGLTPFAWSPVPVRVALMLAVAALIGGTAAPAVSAVADLGPRLVAEFVFGLAIAYAVHLPFAALGFMGRLVDVQVGFGASSIFDPNTRDQQAYLGTALGFAALAVLFATDLHLVLIAGLARTTELVPLGSADWRIDARLLFAATGLQFAYAFLVVAPVVIGLLVLDLCIAYAARAMPQANVYFLSLPLKIGVGLLLLAATFEHAGSSIVRMLESAVTTAVMR